MVPPRALRVHHERMNLDSRGPVVIDTGCSAPDWHRVAGYSQRCIGRYLKAARQLSPLSPWPSLSMEPGWPTGAPTGSGGWSTRLAGPRSSGLDHISPTPRCVPGASGRVAWARRNMRRIAGWRRQRCGFRSLWSSPYGPGLPQLAVLAYQEDAVAPSRGRPGYTVPPRVHDGDGSWPRGMVGTNVILLVSSRTNKADRTGLT